MTTKQRYKAGRFLAKRFAAGKYKGSGTNEPDFMHGKIRVQPYLRGSIKVNQ